MEPTLAGAQSAALAGTLIDWCCSFLDGRGRNPRLAGHILDRRHRCVARLAFMPLAGLVRIMGPESGMRYSEPQDVWDGRVSAIVGALAGGTVFPPLIVTDFWGDEHVSDGCHRLEAYRRVGRTHGWVIVLSETRHNDKEVDG